LVSRGVRLRKRTEVRARKVVKRRYCERERAREVNVAGNKVMCGEIKPSSLAEVVPFATALLDVLTPPQTFGIILALTNTKKTCTTTFLCVFSLIHSLYVGYMLLGQSRPSGISTKHKAVSRYKVLTSFIPISGFSACPV
jgi:hypothetical protein